MPSAKIEGLYFPYANIGSAGILKTALLYFDKIAVIDPRASFCGKAYAYNDFFDESKRFGAEINMDVLIKKGTLQVVDPAKVIAEFGREIMMGVIEDLHDQEFQHLCKAFARSPWVISSAKLPDEADVWLRNLLVNVPTLAHTSTASQESRLFIGEYMPHRLRSVRDIRERDIYDEWAFQRRCEERSPSRYDDEYQSFLHRERMFDEHRVVELPFVVGESIMIGHTLAAAAHGGFIPFCDEQIHLDALKARFRRISNSKVFKAVLHEYGYLKDVKTSILALDVITESVPSLEQVPVETILRFKEKKTDEIENFRVEMRKLITEIESNPWDSDFPKRISDIVDSKVKPAIRKLNNEVRGCKDAFWADAVKTIAQVSPLPIVSTIFAGVPPSVALGVGGTLAGLTLILEQWTKIRKIRRNGWAFLLNAGQLTGRRIR